MSLIYVQFARVKLTDKVVGPNPNELKSYKNVLRHIWH